MPFPTTERVLGRVLVLAVLLTGAVVLDLATGPASQFVVFVGLVAVLAALLTTPRWGFGFTLAAVVLIVGTGAAERSPLGEIHFPVAVAVLVAGLTSTVMTHRRREATRLLAQREAEHRERLTGSLSLLRATLDSTADGLLVVDRSQRITSYNRRFIEMWHLPPELVARGRDEELVRAVLDQLVDPDAFTARVAALYERDDEESLDTLHFKDGRTYERYSCPQRLEGRIVGRVWSFRDVTARNRAEAEAAEARGRLERLLSSSPAVIFSFAAAPPFDVTWMSANIRDLLGYDAAEFQASPHFWKGLAESGDLESRRDWLDRLLHAGRLSEELRFRHRDGRVRWLQIELRVLESEGRHPAEVVGSAMDVTARHDADVERAELRESLLRSEAMSAIGGLVGGVAHEVRNPLFTISATLDAFEARFGLKEEHRPFLEALRSGVERLSKLMETLLDYGRPPRSAPAPTSLFDCVARSIDLLPDPIRGRGVRIENQVPRDLRPALIDRDRMAQVFQNLLENAVQATPAGGFVRVTAAEEELDSRPGIRCRVEDSGTGFKPGEIGRIFEPFYSDRHGGTGLGLAIVQRIVEQHHGRIEADNRPEGGAVLMLWLPAATPAGRETQREDDGAAQHSARR
jgi:PAS domain S-box-containing protein